MAFSGRGAKRRGHCLAGRDGDGRAPVHDLFPWREDDACDRRGHSSRISQREGTPICTGTRTSHPWYPDQPVGLRYSNVVLPKLETGQKTYFAIIKLTLNHMKRYIIGGIAALITLAFTGILTESSQASTPQRYVDEATCHQQNPGVKICPTCKGTGEVGKCIKCSRCGGKGIVKS